MSNKAENLKYKHLAFYVVRDSIGFFFGIPKFLNSLNVEEVVEKKLQDKIKDKSISDKQKDKYRNLITKSVNARITYLKEDHRFCKENKCSRHTQSAKNARAVRRKN